MLIESFAAPMFATNCWVLATGKGAECIVIDPGMPDVSHQLSAILEEYALKPVAVLATHGHVDHTFSIRPIADGYEIPAYIHSQDRGSLIHPQRWVSPEFAATLEAMEFAEPENCEMAKSSRLLVCRSQRFTLPDTHGVR